MKLFLKLGLVFLLALTTAFAAGALAPISVAVGPNEFPAGDVVTLTEVWSDSPTLEPGSRVRVRGRYTLASQTRARVSLSQTRTESRAPVPILPGSGREIEHGSGEFELIYEISQVGCMRVALNHATVGGPSFGTGYFGTPEQLASVKREVRGWIK